MSKETHQGQRSSADEKLTEGLGTLSLTPSPEDAKPGEELKRVDIPELFSLKGQVAAVTGGSRGLGLEMMRSLAACGADVACIDLMVEAGAQACEEIAKTYGVEARFYMCDVADEKQVSSVFSWIGKEFSRPVTILVTAAGIVDNIPAREYPSNRFRRVMDINVNGTFFCAQAAANQMLTSGKPGSIIFVGSMSGQVVNRPQPQAAYNASKAAVAHLAKSLACEWAPHGIRVNVVSPGYMETNLVSQVLAGNPALRKIWEESTPMRRMGQPRELHGVIAFLASEASSYMTGTELTLDGGYTCW
ncbi:uncharacterized protein VTP21DRAFT_3392 [Calcarisporiella thermophila]|uniref:uncharacterized protein n=1 Tax=Calcarisporiella thermophila TaxID=911321 RepID=UPI003741F81A